MSTVPSVVQVCIICLDTESRLHVMSKYKLRKAYENLTGHSIAEDECKAKFLCSECIHRLMNFTKFRYKSLRAHSILEYLVRKYEDVTVDHIKLVDRNKYHLRSDIVKTVFEPGHCDLYIDCSDMDILTEIGATIEADAVKYESVDRDHSRHMTITNKDDVDLQTDLKTAFGNTIVKTEQNYYEDHLDIKSEIINEYDDCIDNTNFDVPNDGYISDSASTFILEPKPILEELLDKTQTCTENTHNLGMAPDPIITSRSNRHAMDQNNYKTETDTKLDTESTKKKKKLQDKLEFETMKNLTLCNESGNFWETDKEENNLLVKRETKKDIVNPYSCTICNYKCKLNISLTVHMRQHNDVKYFTCEFCDHKFKLRHSLNLHMQKHRNAGLNCGLCNSKFDNNDNLYRHMKIHFGENSFACNLCEYENEDNVSFAQHMRTHSGEKESFSCQICDYKFMGKDLLNKHMSLTHEKGSGGDVETQKSVLKTSNRSDKTHACDQCNSKFVSKGNLMRHIKIYCGEKVFTCHFCERKFKAKCDLKRHMLRHTTKKTYPCEYCDQKFSCKSHLKEHAWIHTQNPSNTGVETQKSVIETVNEKYVCEICDSKFVLKNHLTRHMKTHFIEKRYTCQLCDHKFSSKSHLKEHMCPTHEKNSIIDLETQNSDSESSSEGKKYACELCDSKFALKSHLTRHMRTHSGKKPFKCHVCQKKFSQNSGLKKHMLLHTGHKPYSCKTCPYKCTSRIDLVNHQRIHTGEKPFACTYCDFRCNQSYSLITHIRGHTGEKPFACKLCAYKCTRTSQLIRHMQTHTGEKRFSCKLCDYKCTRHCNLQMHMRVHTGDTLSCDYCTFKTVNKACLVVHIKRHMKLRAEIEVNADRRF